VLAAGLFNFVTLSRRRQAQQNALRGPPTQDAGHGSPIAWQVSNICFGTAQAEGRSGMSTPPAAAGVFALLADGATAEIRAAIPDDLDAVRGMYEAMSQQNLYLRFFSLSKSAAGQEARRLCRPADPDHAALLALLNGKIVGAASYEPTGAPGVAEVAFAVADDMHGRGVATLLLEHLVSLARVRHLRAFTAITLGENSAMLRVLGDAGLGVLRRWADGVLELTIPIPRQAALGQDSAYLEAVARREGSADVASLTHLLSPVSVAVVGASRRWASVGRTILRNIRDAGFAGRAYAVNPNADEIDGVQCARSVQDLPEPVDLAVIAVPSPAVPAAVQECGERGIRALVVITSGLGPTQEADILATCRRHDMRLVGPNCLGVVVPGIGLDATFAARHPARGSAGLCVQSGGIGIALLEQLSRLGVGISSFASVGNKLDVSANDMLSWWEQDGVTRLAVLYMESFGNPRKFGRTAGRVGKKIPVLTVHAGRSAPGQRAAASHTAAIAAPLITRQALFEQAGVIATDSLGGLLDVAALLACQPPPAGRRVAIFSNAGGAGVLAADACTEAGLVVHAMTGGARRRLLEILPRGAAVAGPVDTGAAISAEAFRDGLELAAADEGVDAVLTLIVPTGMADLVSAIRSARLPVPAAAVILGQPDAVQLLVIDEDGPAAMPVYAYPESAAGALGHAARYGDWLAAPAGTVPELDSIRATDARALITSFLDRLHGGGWLPAAEVAELLRCYGIPLVETQMAADSAAAAAAAAELGCPVVIKADVPGLLHKSDAGAVMLDLRSPDDVRSAFDELAGKFTGRLAGVLIQPMVTGGVEVIMGVVQEPVFGPLVVFGLGGVATEVLADHSARLAPLTDADADDMIHSIRAAPLLLGHRGTPAADLAALRDALMRVSRLADDLPEVAELDLNPVIARPDGVFAVDARVRVTSRTVIDPFLPRLR
jgi:acyl-CoA synthetase (NDP forming)/GNAT superfamily N-acetyltransferase